VAMVAVAFESIYSLPPPPVRYGPAIVAGWFSLGLLVLFIYKRTGREAWILNAGSEMRDIQTHRAEV
jgi:hypothetical protein